MMPFRVVLYGRPGCCLCDRAGELLESLRADRASDSFVFTLQKVDIDADPNLSHKWRCHIPVVTIDGGNRVALRVTEARLRRAFARAQQRRDNAPAPSQKQKGH